MATIFISYAQSDREHARRLADFLEGSGYTVWWDAGLRPGDVFTIEIQRQINQAKHFIVIWSRVSVASFWVTAETTYARTAGKPILPLSIDEAVPPVPFNLLQTKPFTSIDVSGPEIAETLVRAGTLPALPAGDVDLNATSTHAAGVVRKAQELARWEFIKSSRLASDFETFLQRFPDGDLADLAVMRLESLKWEEVAAAGMQPRDLEAFIAAFPCGVKAPEARRLIERHERMAEQEHWNRLAHPWFGRRRNASRDLAEYVEFLRLHPNGVHARQASSILEKLKREVDLWQTAISKSDRTAVERYIREYPRGSYISEAKALLSRLQRQTMGIDDAMAGANAGVRLGFPLKTFTALALASVLLGCLGAYLGLQGPHFAALAVVSPAGETIYLLHPFPVLIGIFVAFLIHEWGNRSWLTTLFAFAAILVFRGLSQMIGLVDSEGGGIPVNSMMVGAMYCFGAWVAGFIVAPHMRNSLLAFAISIVLGAVSYPNWFLITGLTFRGHELITSGMFFAACTMPIAYSLLRTAPYRMPPAQATAPAAAQA